MRFAQLIGRDGSSEVKQSRVLRQRIGFATFCQPEHPNCYIKYSRKENLEGAQFLPILVPGIVLAGDFQPPTIGRLRHCSDGAVAR
ncbi:UNVERIFIED_CONTAM: hypothetical protein Sangu_2679000 [Sesamum angustifolium]|uniref:Uncharacterized protein n=1 Tax=Sesamum angustifolium TaxID=2727405 RepID=A0AAW2J1D0_9LAMI